MRRLAVAVFLAMAAACSSTPDPDPSPSAASSPVVEAAPSPTPSPSVSPSLAASPSPGPPSSEVASPTPSSAGPVVTGFNAARALALATELADMGHRDAGTPGDAAARAWLTDHWEDAGWTVLTESFPLPQGGSTANVIAVQNPDDLRRPHIVIGGHLDTRNQSPGANDNASGIGVLISAADTLAGDFPVPIVLVGWGAEEYQPAQPRQHHLGSEDYAAKRADHVLAAFVVDMVGNGPVTCICWFDAGPRTLADRLAAVAAQAGWDGYRVEARGGISDHGPFARRGVPAAFLWTYDDGRYHTAADTAEHLDVDDLQRAGDLVVQFTRTLSGDDRDGLQAAP